MATSAARMENQWPSISKILSRQEITLKCAELPEAAMVIKKSEKLCLVSKSLMAHEEHRLPVFVREDELSVWTNLSKHSLFVLLFVSSVKTGTRHLIRLDKLSSVVRLFDLNTMARYIKA